MLRSFATLLLVVSLVPMAYAQEGTEPSSQPEALQASSMPAAAENAEAEEEEEGGLSYGAEIAANSLYIFHGLPLSSGFFLQPYGWVSKGDFEVNAYVSPSLNGDDGVGKVIDFGLGLSYAGKEFGGLSVAPTFYLYGIPATEGLELSGELEVELSYSLGLVSAYLNNAIGLVAAEERLGYWGEAGVAYEGELGEKTAIEASLGVALASGTWNSFNAGLEKAALNGLVAEASAEYALTELLYVRPWAQLSFLLSDELSQAVNGGEALLVNLGAVVGASF